MGLGPFEIMLLAAIALVVIGPEKFPEFAKIVMRTIRDLRTYVSDVQNDIAKELRPVEKEVRNISRYDPESYIETLTRDDEEEEGEAPAPAANADETHVEADTDTAGEHPEKPEASSPEKSLRRDASDGDDPYEHFIDPDYENDD